MVLDAFGTMLDELGRILNVPALHSDSHHSCLIEFPNGQQVQMEVDKSGEFLIVGTMLGKVPPGKYRENLFVEALKANGMPPPLNGILCYSHKTDNLVIFERIHLNDLKADKVATTIKEMLEKAAIWADAIQRGSVPVIKEHQGAVAGGGIFGLRP